MLKNLPAIASVWALLSAPGIAQVPHSFATQQGNVSAQQLDDNFLYNRGVVYPMDAPYNCVGDGVADDTACFQAAATASQGKELYLGPHCYKITSNLVFSGPVHVRGVGAGWASGIFDKSSCIVAGAPNLILFQLFTGSFLKDFAILAGGINPASPTVTNTTGYTVAVANAADVRIEGVWIDHPCIGLDLNGNTIPVRDVYISKVGGSGCTGVRVGNFTTAAATVDVQLSNVTIQGDQSNPPDEDLLVLDAGGLQIQNGNFLYGKIGTKIAPGANQQVIWLYANNTALGDTTVNQGLYVNPASSSAQIKGLNFDNSWTSNASSGDEITLLNTPGAATVTDFNYTLHRAYGAPGNAVSVGVGVANVSFSTSSFCGYGGYGASLASGVTTFSLVGSRVSPTCAGQSGAGTQAINFGGSNSRVNITGDDFTANNLSNPVNGLPTGGVFADNTGIDDNAGTISTSSATLTLNGPWPKFYISSATGGTITAISGAGWAHRFRLTNISGGNITIGGGSGVGTVQSPAVTFGNFGSVDCDYNGGASGYYSCH